MIPLAENYGGLLSNCAKKRRFWTLVFGVLGAATAFQGAGADLMVQLDGHQNGGHDDPAYDIRQQSYPLPPPATPAHPDWRFWLADTEVQQIGDDAVCDDQLINIGAQFSVSDTVENFGLTVKYNRDGSFQVSWNGGRLEATANLIGNDWVELPHLRSPALLRAGASARFFRVVE